MQKCSGLFTALVTPFHSDGSIDKPTLRFLINRQIEAGIENLVILGTTGETPTLSEEEQHEIVEEAIALAAGRCNIVVGTGSYSTSETVKKTKEAKKLGADACLVIFPYYNKPTAEGVQKHFEEIAKAGLPIILYNHPGRTGINLPAKALLRLLSIPEVIGMKDSSGDIDLWLQLIDGSGKAILTGDDVQTPSLLAAGGKGVVSVVSNLFPKEWKTMVDFCLSGDFASARTILFRLAPLCRSMIPNPQCVKYALGVMGLCRGTMRLPMTEPSEAIQADIQRLLQLFKDDRFSSELSSQLQNSFVR